MNGITAPTGPATDQAIERTMKAICRYWARHFEGSFYPDATPHNLTPLLHRRFEDEMQTLWLNADDPFALATEANLRVNPNAYAAFDNCPRYD